MTLTKESNIMDMDGHQKELSFPFETPFSFRLRKFRDLNRKIYFKYVIIILYLYYKSYDFKLARIFQIIFMQRVFFTVTLNSIT